MVSKIAINQTFGRYSINFKNFRCKTRYAISKAMGKEIESFGCFIQVNFKSAGMTPAGAEVVRNISAVMGNEGVLTNYINALYWL